MDAAKLFGNLQQARKEASAENNGGLSKEERAKLTTYVGLHKNNKEKVGSRTTFKVVPLTFKDSIIGDEKPYSSIDGYYSVKVQAEEEGKFTFFRLPTKRAVESYSNSVNKDILDSYDLELLDKINNVLYDIADYYTNFNLKANIAKNVSSDFLSKYKHLAGIQYVSKSLYMPCFFLSKVYNNGSANGIMNFNHFTFLIIEKSLMYEELLAAIENYCYSQNNNNPELVFADLYSGKKVLEITLDKRDSTGKEVGEQREEMFNKPDTVVSFNVSDITSDIESMLETEEVLNYRKIDPLNDYNFFGLKRLDRKFLEKVYSQVLELESYLVISNCMYVSKRQDELEVYLPKAKQSTVSTSTETTATQIPSPVETTESITVSQVSTSPNDGKFDDDDDGQPF